MSLKRYLDTSLVTIFALTFGSGCSTVPRAMAGKIGCPHDEIEIVQKEPGFGIVHTTYTAQCRGRKYICSVSPAAGDGDMSCALSGMASAYRSADPTVENLGKDQSFDEFIGDLNSRAEEDTSVE